MKGRQFHLLALVVSFLLINACAPQYATTPAPGDEDTKPKGFVDGQRDVDIIEYKRPEPPPEKNKPTPSNNTQTQSPGTPTAVPAPVTPAPALTEENPFELTGKKVKIDINTQTMALQVEMRSSDGTETLDLVGSFDKNSPQWLSSLYAADESVKKQRRIQAVAMCLEAYNCDELAVDVFVRFQGKTYKKHFVSKSEVTKPIGGAGRPPKDEEPLPQPPKEESGGSAVDPSENTQSNPLEYDDEVILPAPNDSEFNIEDLPTLKLNTAYSPQAIGSHNKGYLQNASLLKDSGSGFVNRAAIKGIAERDRASYATQLLIDLITKTTAELERIFPNRPPLLIGNLSGKNGGKLGTHRSHRTGLDADVAFLTKTDTLKEFWNPLQQSGLSSEFDMERNWAFIKQLHNTEEDHLIVIFVDRKIKSKLCAYAKSVGEYSDDPRSLYFRALRSLNHEPGHYHHFHVRLLCPNTSGCRNTRVNLPEKTGC